MDILKSLSLPFPNKKYSEKRNELKRKKNNKEQELLVEEQEVDESIDEALDTESISDIYPFSWEEKETLIESGNNFISVLAITGYPTKQYGNWISDLKRKKGNITIIQHLQNASDRLMTAKYNETIKNKEVEIEKSYDPYHRKKLQKQVDSAYMQMEKQLDDQTTFLYQHTYIFIQANSREELENTKSNVEKTLLKLKLSFLTPVKAMSYAYWSSLPVVSNLLSDYTWRFSNSEASSSIIPVDDAEILDLTPKANIEGINNETQSLIAVDYNRKNSVLNKHIVIIGTSGVGKSTYMYQKITQNFALGLKQFIIDPENEYGGAVKARGGQVIEISSNAKTKINPMQIFSNAVGDETSDTVVDTEHIIKTKIQRLKGFFGIIKPGLSQIEKSLLDKVLRETYSKYGLYQETDFAKLDDRKFPILEDVYQTISEMQHSEPTRYKRIEDLHIILESYTHGSNTIFNGYTNVNLKSKLVCFNLKPLQSEGDVQACAYLNIFSYLWDEITKNRNEEIYLFVDECHFLINNPDSLDFFYNAYKRFRKYNAAAIACTQQIQDFLNTEEDKGIGIIGNSYTKVFFGLDGQDLDEVRNKLKIGFSKEEEKLIRSKKRRKALYMHGSKRASMDITLTKEELRVWDKEQYEMKYGDNADIQPSYDKQIEMPLSEEEEARAFIID